MPVFAKFRVSGTAETGACVMTQAVLAIRGKSPLGDLRVVRA